MFILVGKITDGCTSIESELTRVQVLAQINYPNKLEKNPKKKT
jgi:hypothetical protein